MQHAKEKVHAGLPEKPTLSRRRIGYSLRSPLRGRLVRRSFAALGRDAIPALFFSLFEIDVWWEIQLAKRMFW